MTHITIQLAHPKNRVKREYVVDSINFAVSKCTAAIHILPTVARGSEVSVSGEGSTLENALLNLIANTKSKLMAAVKKEKEEKDNQEDNGNSFISGVHDKVTALSGQDDSD
jgi:hypothetical protein